MHVWNYPWSTPHVGEFPPPRPSGMIVSYPLYTLLLDSIVIDLTNSDPEPGEEGKTGQGSRTNDVIIISSDSERETGKSGFDPILQVLSAAVDTVMSL